MAQDAVSFIAALKQVWVSETIEEQLYQKNPLLEAFERVQPQVEVGNTALVPIHVGRNGGYSAVPRTGSNALNAAGAQVVKQAEYNYTHHWFQVELETAVIDETSSKALAVADAVEFEMTGAINDLRRQLTRQLVTNGDGLIAKFAVNAAGVTLKLVAAANQALVRGWVYPGLIVDIGTTANEVSQAENREILEVIPSATEPKIKISGANVETTESHFLSVANDRSGETSYEMNGLQNIVSETAKLGGINPATITQWKANVDSTTTELSLEKLIERQDTIFQQSGQEADWAFTGTKQYRNYYLELQNQVRFNGDGGLQGGANSKLMLGVTGIDKDPDMLDNYFYLLTKKDLIAVRRRGPVWASEAYGGESKPVQYVPGTTKVKGALAYRMQTGVKRRNTHAALTALT